MGVSDSSGVIIRRFPRFEGAANPGGVILPVLDGSAYHAYSMILLPGRQVVVPWPGGAREDHLLVYACADKDSLSASCLLARLGGEELLARAVLAGTVPGHVVPADAAPALAASAHAGCTCAGSAHAGSDYTGRDYPGPAAHAASTPAASACTSAQASTHSEDGSTRNLDEDVEANTEGELEENIVWDIQRDIACDESPMTDARQRIVRQLLAGTILLLHESTNTADAEAVLPEGVVASVSGDDTDGDEQRSWHVQHDGLVWRLFETHSLGAASFHLPSATRAWTAVVTKDDDLAMTSLETLESGNSGKVIWTSPEDLRYWPDGTHPGLDTPLTGSSLPPALSLIAPHLPSVTHEG